MGALREVFASFGVEFDRAGNLQRGNRQTLGLQQQLQGLGAVVGGSFLVMGIQRFVGQTLRIADDLDKVAQQTGLTTREFQAFQHAAQIAGVDAAAFTNTIAQLQLRASQASREGGAMRDAFRRIGVSVTGANGELVSGSELLRRVADGLQNTTNPSLRMAAAMELMSEQGRRMLPMLANGRAGLEGLEEQLDALGGGVSQEFITRSVEINDNMTRWRVSFLSLRSALILNFLPMANRAVVAITRWTATLSRNQDATRLITTLVTALGVAAAAAAVRAAAGWIAAGWPLLLAAAAVAILYLAFEDLWVTLHGGDSVLRQFINELLPGINEGLDGTDQAIASVVIGLATMTGVIQNLGSVAGGIFTSISTSAWNVARGIAAVATLLADVARGDFSGSLVRFQNAVAANDVATREGYQRASTALASGGLGVSEQIDAYREGRMTGGDRRRAVAMLPELRGRGTPRTETKVDARQTVSVTVQEATDPAETERRVRAVVREENDRQARQIAASLGGISAAATGVTGGG